MQVVPWLLTFAAKAPILVALLAGIALSLLNWQEQRRAALLALSGCVLMLITQVGVQAITMAIANGMGRGGSTMNIGKTLMALGTFGSVMEAGGIALLVAAVFVRRSPQPNLNPTNGGAVRETL